ncbi:hypothetical protein ARMGADRAFT_1048480 [Armillaria gallica]|uniref:Uncharacterized protein n=1 Tax=Armillaria gallica TaxID=47427 RepID=A0A2H3CJM7_ARMGA|nr:hypothetical protein ARMGADRAFT_1048480 [Armillaria gallica]
MAPKISLSKGARQPHHEAWTVEHLVHECSVALGFAINMGTAHTYTSALNSYISFYQRHNFPIEPMPDTLSFFVIYMSYHIKPKLVDSYLSGICNQLKHYFPDVHAICKTLLLQLVLDKFNTSTFHDDLLFVAMILTGFYGLLHLAEISMPDSKEFVEIHDDSYSFWLLAHKADTSFKGNRIIIKCQDTTTEDGTALHIIQATGCWSTDTFQIYIWKYPVLLQVILFS